MRSSVIDVAGVTFVATAISYATGIAYYNALFRGLNGNPDLFTVPLEKVLFEGGRQLAYIAFWPILYLSLTVIFAVFLAGIAKKTKFRWLRILVICVSRCNFSKALRKIHWALLFLFMTMITSYAFTAGKEAGDSFARQASCVKGVVQADLGEFTGCVIYKTDAELWIAVREGQKSVLLNIPADKYKSLRVY
ncbi:hypothetical protein [Pseudomonas canadensis]|uniref:hypothetical protein n=1 Tax=Pseudomonas canadensis TaxID=915099 RepID=UPI0027337B1D|nr:hypothetical protein [Pseudomonas canadensis]WLH32671.1 hypothetical protein PSH56_13380 [Pseudomonas canadensis]